VIKYVKEAVPSAPAATKLTAFYDTADLRHKVIDEFGNIVQLYNMGWTDKNIICNGEFSLIQRLGTAALANVVGPSATARIYSADRWGLTVGNTTTPQFEQVDTIAAPETGLKARYYGRYKQLSNAAKHIYSNVIPGTYTSAVRGKVVRFQVRMRYSVGSNRDMRLGLIQNNASATVDTIAASFIPAFNANGSDPTLGTNLAYLTPTIAEGGAGTTISGNAVTCPITNAWQRFSATFLVPTDCRNIIPAIWSNNTLAVNDDVLLTEMGLYDGYEIRDWVPMHQAVELERAGRFCQSYITEQTLTSPGNGTAASTTVAHINVPFALQMRAVPALTVTAGDWQLYDGSTAATAVTALALLANSSGSKGIVLSATVASGLTQFRPYRLQSAAATGKIMIFDAEI
jgi:hypothetical protein